MHRRDFLHTIFWGSFLACTGWRLRHSLAAPFPGSDKNILLNLLLEGGPDFRHLLVPEFNATPDSYGYNYWSARATSHRIDTTVEAMTRRWKEYLRVEKNGVVFGIHPKAAWLRDAFVAGKVAILNNVLHSTTRDHSHSLLVMQSGDYTTGPHDLARNGWGGRLAQTIKGRVISMTPLVKLFCNGASAVNPRDHDNSRVLSAHQIRHFSLYDPEILKTNPGAVGTEAVLTRALRSYYEASRTSIPTTSPYYVLLQHEKLMRELGVKIDERLRQTVLPQEILKLYNNGNSVLSRAEFGMQLRNLYDAFACSDILDFRVGSLAYEGWDSHKRQIDDIEPKIEDIFGQDKGLDLLFRAIKRDMPKAHQNTVLVIAGEFGRQLASNGDEGTDHGRGNSILVIGEKVKGGLYGDMFPQGEITRYRRPNEDITGLTSLERVFGTLCDWTEPASANLVFPNHKTAPIEKGLLLDSLLIT